MKQGCVFVINDKNSLVGYINDTFYKKSISKKSKKIYNTHFRTLSANTESEIIGAESILKEDLTLDILAIIDRNGVFKGSFIRTYPEEIMSYDRLMLQISLASLPAFSDEFVAYLSQQGINKVLLTGEDEDCEIVFNTIKENFYITKYDDYLSELDNNRTLIIDSTYSKSYRGLVFSKWHNALISKLDDVLAASMIDSLFEYIKSRKAKIFFVEGPLKEKLENSELRWPSLFSNNSLMNCLNNDVLLNDFCNGKKELIDWMRDSENGVLTGAQITTNGIHLITANFRGVNCTCLDGVRINNSYNKYLPTIHMYGPCLTFGSCVPDDCTIQHYLHRILEDNNINYNIQNHGVKNGHSNLNDLLYIFNTELRENDVIICLNTFTNLVSAKISEYTEIYCSSDYLNKINDLGMKYLDMSFHTNSVVNKHISRYIYDIVHSAIKNVQYYNTDTKKSYLLESGKLPHIDSSSILSKGMLGSYIKYLKKNKRETKKNSIIGSVLITANPITKGHEYLINYAKQKCDILYVFVVEEDKFYFSTTERMLLVKEVIKDPNIVILSTGTLMTAKFTFPEYFTREKENTQHSLSQIPLLHFQIFGNVVAPLLGITKRFVGTEKVGSITDMYNKELMKYLPYYGIMVEVIKRLEREDGKVISASEIRHLIEKGDFNKLHFSLSEPVIKYIKKKWKKKIQS